MSQEEPTRAIAPSLPMSSYPTPAHVEHRIRTSDGRMLAVAEWGDPKGIPLFDLHGTPGGRVNYWTDAAVYARHDTRRLTIDRPGYGESSRLQGRIVADVATDVESVADALGIGRFAVTGASGGGPHALACANLLGDRVIRCLVEVPPAPIDAEGLDWLAGMNQGNVDEFQAALAGEGELRPLLLRDRKVILERVAGGRTQVLPDAYELSEADRALMEERAVPIGDQLIHALAFGVDGWVDDSIAFVRPWGIDVTSIRVPVHISYGRQDLLVPAAHGDWLAKRIPGAVAFVSDEGHMSDEDDLERNLAWLAGGRRSTTKEPSAPKST